jgi:F-box-like
VQASAFSEGFARVESRFNHFRTIIYPSVRVVALYAIDKEIDELLNATSRAVDAAKQLLHSQLARRNALAPISVLPPEILARVFRFLVFEDPACSRGQNLGWIRATHVCQFWRQVALDDSSLWATIISGISADTKLIFEMLARARNASLIIDIYLEGTPGQEVLHMFPPHLSHTRELRLHGPSILHSLGVQGICSREAPTLEHFELRAPVNSPITFQDPDGTTLFKGQAPRLRTFSLFHVLIPWSLIPRGQLTHLKIVHFEEGFTTDIPFCGYLNHLVDLLVNCPRLEILALERCLPPQLSQYPHCQMIHLPCISRLFLVGSSLRIMKMLKMLKLPSSTRLHLRCTSKNTSSHNDHLLLSVVSTQLQGPAPVELKSLCVTLGRIFHPLVVTASTSVPASRIRQFHGFGDDTDEEEEFVLSFDGLRGLSNKTDLLEGVCKLLPISNLEYLSICASRSLNWVEMFKRCTKLALMQVIGPGTSSLVRALTTPKVPDARHSCNRRKRRDSRDNSTAAQPARSTAAHAHTRIFPKLEFLSLKELDFSEKEHPSGILFDVVEKVLRQRKVPRKAPLRMLRIDDCTISASRAKALQMLVEEFHWDGNEVFLDEYGDDDDFTWSSDFTLSGSASGSGSDSD